MGSVLQAASTIVLAVYSPVIKSDPWSVFKSVLCNPLIISVLAASPFAYFKIPLPHWLETSGNYLAQMTLPLALICIGGTLSLQSLRKSGELALSASAMKRSPCRFCARWRPGCTAFAAPNWGFCSCTSAVRRLRRARHGRAATAIMTGGGDHCHHYAGGCGDHQTSVFSSCSGAAGSSFSASRRSLPARREKRPLQPERRHRLRNA